MKAVLCNNRVFSEIVERPSPARRLQAGARLAVSHVGICGTDCTRIFEGKHPFLEYPRVMGHEDPPRPW